MRVWVTRARPGAERTAERLAALGFTPLVVPLLEIRPLDVTIDLAGIEALAFTSLNGVAAFTARCGERSLPVLAVGDATAGAARDAGFRQVHSARGDLGALAALIRQEAAGLSILHPCAAEPAGDLAGAVGDGANVRAVPVYGARETGAVPPQDWDAVLFHSPRAARALQAGIGGGVAVALSPAVAASLSDRGFAAVHIAASPTETALLEALARAAPTALGNPGSDV
ncbi:MAG: uroporphyrinogen-III synthase [Brevundimonas sp.]|uniref:uroporphyrinogen-III synthase n=1 Tax=Brevundimonas sp. TaxID=1871086 RepID=UPI002733CCB8|nr:uroporphyrinogen-III synthase [Brevundimonas sp.]MDP3404715.1 uroporphyrinogen-III synthase [Brevundimonas sp.]